MQKLASAILLIASWLSPSAFVPFFLSCPLLWSIHLLFAKLSLFIVWLFCRFCLVFVWWLPGGLPGTCCSYCRQLKLTTTSLTTAYLAEGNPLCVMCDIASGCHHDSVFQNLGNWNDCTARGLHLDPVELQWHLWVGTQAHSCRCHSGPGEEMQLWLWAQMQYWDGSEDEGTLLRLGPQGEGHICNRTRWQFEHQDRGQPLHGCVTRYWSEEHSRVPGSARPASVETRTSE